MDYAYFDLYGNDCTIDENRRIWPKKLPSDPKGLICLIHGTHEHSGRYGDFANNLSSIGFIVFAQDLPGHGMSANDKKDRNGDLGRDGFFNSVEDIVKQIEDMKEKFPNLPLIVFGHSLGSMIAFHVSLRAKPDKLILSGNQYKS